MVAQPPTCNGVQMSLQAHSLGAGSLVPSGEAIAAAAAPGLAGGQEPLPGCSSPSKDQTFYSHRVRVCPVLSPEATGTGLGQLGDRFELRDYVKRGLLGLGEAGLPPNRHPFFRLQLLPDWDKPPFPKPQP